MLNVMPITGALAAVLVAAPGALAQVTSSPDTAKSPWPTVNRTPTFGDDVSADSSFVRQAMRGNYIEVALGRLAESRAEDDGVESFAERMISDHNSMNEEWTALANDNDMKVFPEFGPAGQQTIDRLEDLDGDEFDQAYMAEMIRQHEQDLATFGRMRQSARSSEVRQLASTGESAIRQHLALAQQVGSGVGVATTAGRAGGVPAPAPVPSNEDRTGRTSDGATGDERDDRNNGSALRSEDRAFVQNVLQDHLMHIKLAQRAQREATSDETRRLAERMEKDFTEWQGQWEDLAARYEVKAPTHLGNLHGKKVDKLEGASKGSFDQTYASIVADHLASVVPYFEKEGQEVGVAAARRLVDDELPMIRENLSRAKQLEGKANEKERNSDRN